MFVCVCVFSIIEEPSMVDPFELSTLATTSIK